MAGFRILEGAQRPIQSPIQWARVTLTLRVNRPGNEANHSPTLVHEAQGQFNLAEY